MYHLNTLSVCCLVQNTDHVQAGGQAIPTVASERCQYREQAHETEYIHSIVWLLDLLHASSSLSRSVGSAPGCPCPAIEWMDCHAIEERIRQLNILKGDSNQS
jgi:hypothetical protein